MIFCQGIISSHIERDKRPTPHQRHWSCHLGYDFGHFRSLRSSARARVQHHLPPLHVARPAIIPHELSPHTARTVRVAGRHLRPDHRHGILHWRFHPAASLLLCRAARCLCRPPLVHCNHGHCSVRVRLCQELLCEWMEGL